MPPRGDTRRTYVMRLREGLDPYRATPLGSVARRVFAEEMAASFSESRQRAWPAEADAEAAQPSSSSEAILAPVQRLGFPALVAALSVVGLKPVDGCVPA